MIRGGPGTLDAFALISLLFFPKGGSLIMAKSESRFQSELIRELKDRLPGCYVLKNDAGYLQGVPDLLVLYGDKWGTLECKRSKTASHRPNQDYHVQHMDEMSFSRFIFPENKEEVLDEMVHALRPRRKARVSGSK